MKNTSRRRGRDRVKQVQPLLDATSSALKRMPRPLRTRTLRALRNLNGYHGLAARYTLISSSAHSCGTNVSIHPTVFLFGLERMEIGSNVSVHPMCYLDGTGGITIEDDVSIAHSTTIMSTNHIFHNPNIPVKDQGISESPTKICKGAWLASHVVVLAGCTIGEGAVIGAGAVVTKDIPAHSIAVGVPAQVVGQTGIADA